MSTTLDEAAARLAREQHGLITRRQALDLGFSANAIGTRRRAGRWVTVESGVYAINGAPITWHLRALALCLALDGVASHRSAAALLGVDGFGFDVIEISIPRGRHVARDGVVLHECTDLHLFSPVLVDGIPTTPVGRLAVDLGSVVSFARFDRAIDDLIRRKQLTWVHALHQLLAHSRRGRNGYGALRALLLLRFGEDVGESVLERAFLRELRRRGLPTPVSQHVIRDRHGFIARVDFAYPSLRIAIELDGRRYHGAPVFESDRDKRARLTTAGWAVLEITWKMLFEDARKVFRRLADLIASRSEISALVLDHAAEN